MEDMSSDLKMLNTIIDCHEMRKNEMFVIIDSLFSESVSTHVVTLTQKGTSVYLGQTHLGTPL